MSWKIRNIQIDTISELSLQLLKGSIYFHFPSKAESDITLGMTHERNWWLWRLENTVSEISLKFFKTLIYFLFPSKTESDITWTVAVFKDVKVMLITDITQVSRENNPLIFLTKLNGFRAYLLSCYKALKCLRTLLWACGQIVHS